MPKPPLPTVTAFTDTYHPTVNGVTYTLDSWQAYWHNADSTMQVVYPGSSHTPQPSEYPVRSVPFPFYDGFRVGAPTLPSDVSPTDIAHAHTGYTVGLSALRYARQNDIPFVATYHTPISEYTSYFPVWEPATTILENGIEHYERWFYTQAAHVIVPSQSTRDYLTDQIGVDTPITVLSNGVDTDFFSPTSPTEFLEAHDVPDADIYLGYTGRHGHEKNLSAILEMVTYLDDDVAVLFGGAGPASPQLKSRAQALDVPVKFFGFLDRQELPAFYSLLDVFVFPSPVETEGLVAMESIACGTPVVGVNAGALTTTIDDGITGKHYTEGNTREFATNVATVLASQESFEDQCLEARDELSITHTISELTSLYNSLL